MVCWQSAFGHRSGAALDIGPLVVLAAEASSPYEPPGDGTPREKRGPIGNPSGAGASSRVGFMGSSLASDKASSQRRRTSLSTAAKKRREAQNFDRRDRGSSAIGGWRRPQPVEPVLVRERADLLPAAVRLASAKRAQL